MVPVKSVRLQLGELLAADVTTLAPVAANKVALIIAPFTPSESLTLASLTLATFTGSAPKAGVAGAQQAGVDPVTGDQVITNLAPAGGWRFEATAAPTPPQVVYGYALTDSAGAVLLATALLPFPATITNIGDFVDLGSLTLTFTLTPLT